MRAVIDVKRLPAAPPGARRPVAVVAVASAAVVASLASVVAVAPDVGLLVVPVAVLLVATAVTDVRSHRVPADWISWAGLATGVLLIGQGLAEKASARLVDAVIAGAVTWLVWWTIRVVSRGGMGYGDVRLAAVAAVPLGAVSPAAAVLLTPATFVAAAVSILPLVGTYHHRERRVPLAPAIAVAWALCLLYAVHSTGSLP